MDIKKILGLILIPCYFPFGFLLFLIYANKEMVTISLFGFIILAICYIFFDIPKYLGQILSRKN